MKKIQNIAYFITAHGFGHTTRSISVMAAFKRKYPEVNIHIYSTAPRWIIDELLENQYHYHEVFCDVGLIQKCALWEDLPATIDALNQLIPYSKTLTEQLLLSFSENNIQAVISDISPLGIYSANKASIPSFLIENFTWDWIYEGYIQQRKEFQSFCSYLKPIFRNADFHIQTQPITNIVPCDLTVGPVSRPYKHSITTTRQSLQLSRDEKIAIISMGGVPKEFDFIEHLHSKKDWTFIIAGSGNSYSQDKNVLKLPYSSNIYHPDLIRASDVVIAKLGYSTLAETYNANIPHFYIPRVHFKESPPLATFADKHIHGVCIQEEDFKHRHWLEKLNTIPDKTTSKDPSIAPDQIVDFIISKL